MQGAGTGHSEQPGQSDGSSWAGSSIFIDIPKEVVRSEKAGTKKGRASAGGPVWPWGTWRGRLRPEWQGAKVAQGTSQWDWEPESVVSEYTGVGEPGCQGTAVPRYWGIKTLGHHSARHWSVGLLWPQGRYPGLGPTRTSRTGDRGAETGKGGVGSRAEPAGSAGLSPDPDPRVPSGAAGTDPDLGRAGQCR